MPQSPKLFGIPNCDTVKRARSWLADHAVAYEFHDFKKEGVQADQLAGWVDEHGWEKMLNKRGTTFRKLPEADKIDIEREKAITLLLANPSMIKRPILDLGDRTIVGFDEIAYFSELS